MINNQQELDAVLAESDEEVRRFRADPANRYRSIDGRVLLLCVEIRTDGRVVFGQYAPDMASSAELAALTARVWEVSKKHTEELQGRATD